MTELDDRRQRALEAGQDAVGMFDQNPAGDVLEAAIETATRVRITPEIIAACHEPSGYLLPAYIRDILKAAFEAAGFEVED